MNDRDSNFWNRTLTRQLSRRAAIRGFGLAGIGLSAAAVLGCSSGGDDKAKVEPPPEVTAIRLPQSTPLCESAQFLAEKYLANEGFTDVKFVPYQAPTVPWMLVSSGEADFGVDNLSLLLRSDAGEPVTFLGGFHTGCGAWVANDSIKTAGDFKGRTIGVGGMDPLVNFDYLATQVYLGNAGLNPGRDVTFTLRPGPLAQLTQPFNEGKFDGFWAGVPVLFQARAAKLGHEVSNMMMDKPWSDNYCCGVGANRNFVQKNPVATKRALRALMMASDEAEHQPETAARYIVDKGYRPNYDDVIQSFKEMGHNRWREMDHEASARFWLRSFQSAGLLKGTPEKLLSDSVNLSFLNELKKAKA
jgi:NitT/TauT family transport system substrate-binding protein